MLYEVITIEIDAEYRSPYGDHLSTMIDFTDDVPQITREGLGIELVITSYSIHYTKLYDTSSCSNSGAIPSAR